MRTAQADAPAAAEAEAVDRPEAREAAQQSGGSESLPEAVVVTPEQAARLAVERSWDIEAAVASVDEARARVREARALRGLYGSLDMSYTRQGPEPPSFEFMGERISFFNAHVRTQRIGFTKTLYTWGRHELTEHVAKLGALIAQDRSDMIRLATAQLALEKAYFVLLYDELLTVAVQNVTALREHERVAEEKHAEGLIAFVEVLQAQAQRALAERDVATAERLLEVERAALRQLLLLPQDTPLVVEAGGRLPVGSLELRECVSYALERRPDLVAARRGAELARQSVRLARRTSRPSLTGTVGVQRQNSTSLSEDLSYQAVLALQIPILDGGLRRASVEGARGRLAQAEARQADLEHEVAYQVRQALAFVTEADAKREKALASEKAGRESLRISRLRYEYTEATGQEVIDATAVLAAARGAEAQALFERAIALSKLRLAMGVPLDGFLEQTATQGEEGP